jgi:uridine kinase
MSNEEYCDRYCLTRDVPAAVFHPSSGPPQAGRMRGDRMPVRTDVISTLADVVTSLDLPHPTRVAVEGRSAAGKTTFADDLAGAVRARGCEALRASVDDFHPLGYKFRSQRGEFTPRAYFEEGYDYHAFAELLLRPLGPGGTRRCRTALFDSYHDTWLPEVWHDVGDRAVVVVDGAYLLHPELAGHWDYIIWLDIDIETMVERARRRDVAWMESEQRVVEHYRRNWTPRHEFYERPIDPRSRAHAVIDNRNLRYPVILSLIRL